MKCLEICPHLSYSISYPIRASREMVFEAIRDDRVLVSYFARESSGPLAEGVTVRWTWERESAEFSVDRLIPPERIEAHWQAYGVEYDVATTFELRSRADGATIVTITETGFHDDESGRIASYSQCSGWTEFLLLLRARLEHDVDLRT